MAVAAVRSDFFCTRAACLEALPGDLVAAIFSRLDIDDFTRASLASKSMRRLLSEKRIWEPFARAMGFDLPECQLCSPQCFIALSHKRMMELFPGNAFSCILKAVGGTVALLRTQRLGAPLTPDCFMEGEFDLCRIASTLGTAALYWGEFAPSCPPSCAGLGILILRHQDWMEEEVEAFYPYRSFDGNSSSPTTVTVRSSFYPQQDTVLGKPSFKQKMATDFSGILASCYIRGYMRERKDRLLL